MRILLVDDHAIVRTGLRNLLTSVSDNQISEAATDGTRCCGCGKIALTSCCSI